ncbi:MAG: hypothetical protein WCW27_04555 [Patescibacteria group bacterium]|jgi:hypothetical protein
MGVEYKIISKKPWSEIKKDIIIELKKNQNSLKESDPQSIKELNLKPAYELNTDNQTGWPEASIYIEENGLFITRHDCSKNAFLHLDNIKEKLEALGGYTIKIENEQFYNCGGKSDEIGIITVPPLTGYTVHKCDFFSSYIDKTVEDIIISDCSFDNCSIVGKELSVLVRNVSVSNLVYSSCGFHKVIFDHVIFNNIRTKYNRGKRDLLFFWGCLFNQVRLSGRITTLKINSRPDDCYGKDNIKQANAWDNFIRKFYADIEFALDIRQANFTSAIEFDGIPGSKILFSNDTAALISRKTWNNVDLKNINDFDTVFKDIIQDFLKESIFDETVLAVAGTGKDQKNDLRFIQQLYDLGLAEKCKIDH